MPTNPTPLDAATLRAVLARIKDLNPEDEDWLRRELNAADTAAPRPVAEPPTWLCAECRGQWVAAQVAPRPLDAATLRARLAEAWWRGRRSANERQGEWAGPELRERCAKDIADLTPDAAAPRPVTEPCAEAAKPEAGPMRDTESPSGVQALGSSGLAQPRQDCGALGHLFGAAGTCVFCDTPKPAEAREAQACGQCECCAAWRESRERDAADRLAATVGETDEAERLRWTIRNIRLCAAVGRLFGHQATPHTPEKMVERKDFRFDQILKYCADAGETGSLLRDEVPHAD